MGRTRLKHRKPKDDVGCFDLADENARPRILSFSCEGVASAETPLSFGLESSRLLRDQHANKEILQGKPPRIRRSSIKSQQPVIKQEHPPGIRSLNDVLSDSSASGGDAAFEGTDDEVISNEIDGVSQISEDEDSNGSQQSTSLLQLLTAPTEQEEVLADANKEQFELADVLLSLEGHAEFAGLKRQLEILQAQKRLSTPAPQPVRDQADRVARYGQTVKAASRWTPQMIRARDVEQVVYGSVEPHVPGVASAGTTDEAFKPRTPLEKAVLTNDTLDNEGREELGCTPTAEPIRRQQKYHKIKQMLFQEQRKARRLNRIKSKMWRKIRRRTETIERERIIAHLEDEDPEMAEQIRREWETKRAQYRLMKKTASREKWAKMATRFGGRDVSREVSRQAQDAHDEKSAIERVTKRHAGEQDESNSDRDSDDESISFSDEDGQGTPTVRTIAECASQLVRKEIEEESTELPAKGVMGMRFMRDYLNNEKKKREEEAAATLSEIQSAAKGSLEPAFTSRNNEDDESGGSSANEDENDKQRRALKRRLQEGDRKMQQQNRAPKLPKFSAEEIARAEQALESALGASEMTSLAASGPMAVDVIDAETRTQKQHQDREKQNRAMIGEAFGSRVLVGDESSDEERERSNIGGEGTAPRVEDDRLPGWGSWTGDDWNLCEPKHAQEEHTQPKKKAPLVVVNRRLDKKLLKFMCLQRPRSSLSDQDYQLDLQTALGREWNTAAVTKRLTQPSVVVHAGTVVAPLEYMKNLSEKEADSLLGAWKDAKNAVQKKRSHARL